MTNPGSANIPKIAQLARLYLSPEEEARMESDITKILAFMDELNHVNVDGVEPTANISGLSNMMREDTAIESGLQERLVASAPAIIDDVLIRVPAVLPGEGMA